jgi:ATP-dependent Clp protease adapter protein ClpS
MLESLIIEKQMSQTVLQPEVIDSSSNAGRWMVVIFNNDDTSMDEVIEILMVATQCTFEEAYIEMWEAHMYGKAPVHFASREECMDAARIIETVGVKTEVTKEWED